MTGQELVIKHDKEALAKAFKIPQSSIVWMGGRKYACVIKEEETIVINHPRSKLAIIGLVNELKEYIVSCKAEGKRECDRVVQYDFGQDLPKVNAEWLLKGLQAFPNGKLYSEDGISHKGIKLYIMDEEKDEGLLILWRRK